VFGVRWRGGGHSQTCGEGGSSEGWATCELKQATRKTKLKARPHHTMIKTQGATISPKRKMCKNKMLFQKIISKFRIKYKIFSKIPNPLNAQFQ